MRTQILRPILPSALLLAAALGLSGCLTTEAKPKPSQAVLDARAHKDVDAVAKCGDLVSPISVGFGFGEGSLSELAAPNVDQARQALACHPDANVVIVGQADGHGTEQEQTQLAHNRAEVVAEALRSRGVSAGRLKTQTQGTAPSGDAQHLVILAEGRRW
jgi:outer membrane protein OmpA-like peptidoglycan-associated protein